ncbi:von Willebrand factor C and EGF domain-containing protein-like isoform X2 [Mya arenaria]|uniref:von Willebrand factor C and EGF domain-containing protein-like isoform X2 n=1 Tax=Mya arenaria TaxID=6604 RepID=UPI0022DF7A58|nr:von Willebrand factor C and EGF domain-containing protein-like isoform X2 [Mya arenaria]
MLELEFKSSQNTMSLSTVLISAVIALVLTSVNAAPSPPLECAVAACMIPDCPDGEVITNSDSCCPICSPIYKKCFHTDGKTYAHGETFKDKCNSCVCRDGSVSCTKIGCIEKAGECPTPWPFGECTSIHMCTDDWDCPNEQKCCRNGCGKVCRIPITSTTHRCYQSGVWYNDGETVPQKESNPCLYCRCHNGVITCDPVMCPACEGIRPPGACCPDCSWAAGTV